MGCHYLEDVLETMGDYMDILKFAGGSFTLMPTSSLKAIHRCVPRSQGSLCQLADSSRESCPHGQDAVRRYLDDCKRLGFAIVEISRGFISVPHDDLVRLTEHVQKTGLKSKPEVGIQFGAGGASGAEVLEAEGTNDAG